MTALKQSLYKQPTNFIEQEIQNHPTWFGQVSGLAAEKMLRNKQTAYLFLLRAGESEDNYYVTFTQPNGSINHQPFVITTTHKGWFCENGTASGPYAEATIDDVLHLVMHCKKDECVPFVNFGQL